MYSTETAGNIEYLAVHAADRDFIWTSCSELTGRIADKLHEKARERGGNALIGVQWRKHDSGELVRPPTCTTGWGWLAIPPGIGALYPWVRRAEAQGIAIYAEKGQIEELREGIEAQRESVREAEEEEAQDVEQDATESEDRAE